MNCERCGEEHTGIFGSGRFCSRKCSNSRGPRTEEFKKSVSKKLKGRKGHRSNLGKKYTRVERETRICKCGESFVEKITTKRKFCSSECRYKNSGGYREGSGRAKTGYYKGIYCGSTYELVWVIYMLDHNISFQRFEGCLEGNGIKYFPDFIVGSTIHEMKGYESIESVDKKTKLAESFGYEVKVLRKLDLQDQFNWVKTNYTYKRLHELYDDFKPKYEYNCCICGSHILRHHPAKTKDICCSQRCTGLNLVKNRNNRK
jgi:hypothetical protein